jgi:hypothetical protein
MTVLEYLRTRRWSFYRRFLLVIIVLVLALRNYGDRVATWIMGAGASGDVIITHYEFRPELPGSRPAWIINVKNQNRKVTYDRIELDATYFDANGTVLDRDKLVIRQKLAPGEEQLVGSIDVRDRPGAQSGTLTVSDAQRVPQ